jgi:hypothetical protein
MKQISNIHLGIGAVLLIIFFIYLYKGTSGEYNNIGDNIGNNRTYTI